jgi:hypothetical protein
VAVFGALVEIVGAIMDPFAGRPGLRFSIGAAAVESLDKVVFLVSMGLAAVTVKDRPGLRGDATDFVLLLALATRAMVLTPDIKRTRSLAQNFAPCLLAGRHVDMP